MAELSVVEEELIKFIRECEAIEEKKDRDRTERERRRALEEIEAVNQIVSEDIGELSELWDSREHIPIDFIKQAIKYKTRFLCHRSLSAENKKQLTHQINRIEKYIMRTESCSIRSLIKRLVGR